jgi:hypothetical protein
MFKAAALAAAAFLRSAQRLAPPVDENPSDSVMQPRPEASTARLPPEVVQPTPEPLKIVVVLQHLTTTFPRICILLKKTADDYVFCFSVRTARPKLQSVFHWSRLPRPWGRRKSDRS